MISFEVDRPTAGMIEEILNSAIKMDVIKRAERLNFQMSLCACIAQGTKLDLKKLLSFDAFNLAHDLLGIHRHIDKEESSPTAGKLLNCFWPRCAAKDQS